MSSKMTMKTSFFGPNLLSQQHHGTVARLQVSLTVPTADGKGDPGAPKQMEICRVHTGGFRLNSRVFIAATFWWFADLSTLTQWNTLSMKCPSVINTQALSPMLSLRFPEVYSRKSPCANVFPIEKGDFPFLCQFTGGYDYCEYSHQFPRTKRFFVVQVEVPLFSEK